MSNIVTAENITLSSTLSFDGPYPSGIGEEWIVYGAAINGADWKFRNDGNGTFYVSYALPDGGDDRTINWEPADPETQELIPPRDDLEACARFAHALILSDDTDDADVPDFSGMMHVNPLASDGNFTIGYDADGLAGEWPGNMADMCHPVDFIRARIDKEFSDGAMTYFCVLDGEDTVWANPDGSVTPVRQILADGGDR